MNIKPAIASILITAWACAKATPAAEETGTIEIPQQGNTFVTACNGTNFVSTASGIIDTHSGELKNWTDDNTVISLFFKLGKAGTFLLSVEATAGKPGDMSTLQFSMDSQQHIIDIHGGKPELYQVGKFTTDSPGYVKIDIRGLRKTGPDFGKMEKFTIGGEATTGENHFIPSDKLSDCYWYRRGPSVHMNYELPEADIEYFYSEATIPAGHDIHGTYFMLTGFGEGYMGIQAIHDDKGNNANKVLFSVWSPYTTDNPNEIPDSLHVRVLKKGTGVTAQNFGNEGSGKQSFMHYPWATGKTYRTLVRVQPDGKGNTVYTGYFGDDNGNWHLLSQLLRPATDTYYKRPHSFLECFIPETSINTRSVTFKNQWARDKDGIWHEITNATFTCDGTGRSGVRTDLYGGVQNNAFILQNCGFFDKTTDYRSTFSRNPTGNIPQIDFDIINAL